MIKTRGFCPTKDRQIDHVWDLNGQFVKSQRGNQTNHSVGNTECHTHEIGLRKRTGLRKLIHASRETLNLPALLELYKGPGRNAE